MTDSPKKFIILFCGLPGTLKTLLATRLTGRLGWAYLPTRAAGPLISSVDGPALQMEREQRYSRVAEISSILVRLGASVIVDGGFLYRSTREAVLKPVQHSNRLVVHCFCNSVEVRRRRLARRALESHDHESESAKAILEQGVIEPPFPELPQFDVEHGVVGAVLDVDTETGDMAWWGEPPRELEEVLSRELASIMSEYLRHPNSMIYESIVREHFEELSEAYDDSTPWRSDRDLLNTLAVDLGHPPARVLDLGAGTGLATEQFAEQGHHVVGLDISPAMLTRAAAKLTVTVLGSVMNPPFLPGYFDLVIARQCLHYVEPERLLLEAGRMLRPEGWMVISGIIAPDEKSRRFWLEFKAATQPLRLDVFTEAMLNRLLSRSGFAVEKCFRREVQRTESVADFMRRAPEPDGGWLAFLESMERLAGVESPGSNFKLGGESISYRQHWLTIWSKNIGREVEEK